MDLTEELAKAIRQQMLETRSFDLVPAKGAIKGVVISEPGKFGPGIEGVLDEWYVTYDEQLKKHTLVVKREGKVVSFCSLTAEGVWKGRDRVSSGFMLLRPMKESLARWKQLADPVQFYRSLQVDEAEDSFHYLEPLSPQFDWEPYALNLAEELNLSELVQSQTAIAIVAYDRPNYFKQTVHSIAQNELAHTMPVFVFLDRPDEPARIDVMEEQAKEARLAFPNAVIIKRPKNFGCGRNIIDARRQLFDVLGYRRAFIFEDDMIIAPNYVQFTINLFNWAEEHYTNIGAVQGWSHCDLDLDDKLLVQDVVKATFTNWWGYCMSQRCWDSIKAEMYKFENLFLRGEYRFRPHQSIRHWFRLKMSRPAQIQGVKEFPRHPELARDRKHYFDNPATGQDAATMHLFECCGWTRLCPIVNRAKYIGKQGIHMTPRLWASQGFDHVSFDLLSGDSDLKEFVLFQDGKDRLTRDEEEAVTGLRLLDRT